MISLENVTPSLECIISQCTTDQMKCCARVVRCCTEGTPLVFTLDDYWSKCSQTTEMPEYATPTSSDYFKHYSVWLSKQLYKAIFTFNHFQIGRHGHTLTVRHEGGTAFGNTALYITTNYHYNLHQSRQKNSTVFYMPAVDTSS